MDPCIRGKLREPKEQPESEDAGQPGIPERDALSAEKAGEAAHAAAGKVAQNGASAAADQGFSDPGNSGDSAERTAAIQEKDEDQQS